MASESAGEPTSTQFPERSDSLHVEVNDVSRSTDRRYNQVVQEYIKRRLLKSDSEHSNISPSQVLSMQADKAGPNEGSYVSWECPDTPQSPKSGGFKERDSRVGASFYSVDDPDPVSFHSLDSKMTSTAQVTRNPADGTRFGSADSKASYVFENAFQNTDPFSPLAKNVVSLSFSSLQSPEELEMKSPMGGGYRSPMSEGAREGSGKKMSPPKVAFVFPSPDSRESKQGRAFTTFTKFDGARDNDNYSPVPIHTPTESQDSSVSHHTPSIWITNVSGSIHNLLGTRGEKENTRRRVQSWTGEPTPPDENKSRLKHQENRSRSESVYPPEETNTKSYTFNPLPFSSKDRSYSVDTSDATTHMYSPSPNYMVSDDLYCKQDISDYERTLDCKERVGWCLIIFGLAIFISAVVVILVVEIPAHNFEEEEFEPDSKPFYDYMEGVKEDVMSNLR